MGMSESLNNKVEFFFVTGQFLNFKKVRYKNTL